MLCLDLVVAADPRQAGADGRCLATLLESAANAGYRTGLLPLRGASSATAQRIGAALRPLFGDGRVDWLDTDALIQADLIDQKQRGLDERVGVQPVDPAVAEQGA